MKYDIPSKPTKYNGRLYRSRLEARWAAMLDMLGWEYEYEPCDFTNWSPDFLLKESKVYVEVKPVTSVQEMDELHKDYIESKLVYNAIKHDISVALFFSEIKNGCFGLGIRSRPTFELIDDKVVYSSKYSISSFVVGDQSMDKLFVEAANKVMFLKPK